MHPSKPGNHTYGSSQARTQELTKNQKIEIEGNTSNYTESIQIAPRDYHKLNFSEITDFSNLAKLAKFTPKSQIFQFTNIDFA